jgi:hypothetical protein
MSRGGRARGGGAGRGRGKKNGGPETTWDVEPTEISTAKPDPLFPVRVENAEFWEIDLQMTRKYHNLCLSHYLDKKSTDLTIIGTFAVLFGTDHCIQYSIVVN